MDDWQFAEKGFAKQTQEKAPSIWMKLMKGLEMIGKMSQHVETAGKAIGNVMKAIEQISGNPKPPVP